jgi:hypothetical protein
VKNSIPKCNTPWCGSFGSKKSMLNLRKFSKGKYIKKTNLYKQHHICIDCWSQVGINKVSDRWAEINLSITLLKEIEELKRQDFTVNKISKKLNIEYYKIVIYLGYLYRFDLTPKSTFLLINIIQVTT